MEALHQLPNVAFYNSLNFLYVVVIIKPFSSITYIKIHEVVYIYRLHHIGIYHYVCGFDGANMSFWSHEIECYDI